MKSDIVRGAVILGTAIVLAAGLVYLGLTGLAESVRLGCREIAGHAQDARPLPPSGYPTSLTIQPAGPILVKVQP